jgi:NapC/NirT cytochrome c family, N-terminal region
MASNLPDLLLCSGAPWEHGGNSRTWMGADLGPLFVDEPRVHLLWIVAFIAAAAAIVLAVYAMVRGRIPAELGMAGLVVVPGVALLLANLEVVDRSKQMAFCGSCHEPMAPVVTSVIEANGSLASIHYQSGAIKGDEACYTCHSGYGLVGDIAAKTAGLRHMWHEYWRSYEYPLAMNRPFDIDACLDCHRHAPKFRAVPCTPTRTPRRCSPRATCPAPRRVTRARTHRRR